MSTTGDAFANGLGGIFPGAATTSNNTTTTRIAFPKQIYPSQTGRYWQTPPYNSLTADHIKLLDAIIALRDPTKLGRAARSVAAAEGLDVVAVRVALMAISSLGLADTMRERMRDK